MKTRLKNIANVVMGQSLEEKEIFDIENEKSFEFHQGNKLFESKNNIGKSKVFGLTGKLAHEGDVLFSVRAPVGDIAILNRSIIIGRGLAAIRASKSIDRNYLYYMLNTSIQKLKEEQTGTTFDSITTADLRNLIVEDIPKEQQIKIANYLDTETSKIDRKISILEQKYKKLEEYKQSVIFETVTKGLNSNVAMKYSGIDWIGDIPSHWEIKRVKDTSKIKKGKAVETFFEKDSNMLPCIDTNFLRGRDNVVYCSNGVKILSDKVLILWDGANAGELFFNKDIGYLGSTFGVFNTTLNNQFWFYYLKGIEQYSRDNLTGMGIPHVDGNVLKQTIALVPSKQEQELIVNFLNIETSKIDKKKEIIKKQIELLKEYKQTIIYEAVTGKKEIL